jgi:hypothetical protein
MEIAARPIGVQQQFNLVHLEPKINAKSRDCWLAQRGKIDFV